MGGLDPTDEKEEGCGGGGDTIVRPAHEMELAHNALLTATTLPGQEEGTDHEDWENGRRSRETHTLYLCYTHTMMTEKVRMV